MSDIHADRRAPAEPDGPLDIAAEGDRLLDQARGMSSGRAARTLTPGAHTPLKQTLVALRAGVELDEHQANGPATIQLLKGAATMNSPEGAIQLHGGQWAQIPDAPHNLHAEDDTVALITVAPPGAAAG
jgi:quercetin dioxygenase-like cupin family protein